jgi:NAD(P)H-dependent FMN reductase
MSNKIKILAISGSLRPNSSNTLLVQAISKMVPDYVDFSIYENLESIPFFNDSDEAPGAVRDFRNKIAEANGVLVCSPEYAFGISGVLKNALDWTVSSSEFMDKPVAVITAAVNGEKAHAALLQVFEALSANVIEGGTLIIPFIRAKLNLDAEITDQSTLLSVSSVLNSLIGTIQKP